MERTDRVALLSARPTLGILILASAALLAPTPGSAQSLTQDEALRLAFPEADSVARRTAYLDAEGMTRAEALAGDGAEVPSEIVTYYVAYEKGAAVGTAYFDAHRVRTLAEVLMVVVDPDARVRRVEVVRFGEPPEYRAPAGWMAQFHGRGLDQELAHRRGIANMTGATLTSRAATAAVRRVLALHAVIGSLTPDKGGSP